MDLSYDEWCAQVDALCARHLLNDWANLCGDTDVLERGFEDGWTPLRFGQWWAEKYDLTWFDPDDPDPLHNDPLMPRRERRSSWPRVERGGTRRQASARGAST